MLIILLILVGAWFLISSSYFNKDTEKKFDVNPLFFKAVIEENSSIVNNLQITNIDSVLRHFLIQLDNMDGLVTLNQLEFDLESNEIKEIQISFNSINKKPGIYLGELEIFSGDKTQHIQIVLEVQTKEVLFDGNLNLFSSDGEIIPGQKLNTEIKIFDLVNIGRSNIELEYFIKPVITKNIFEF